MGAEDASNPTLEDAIDPVHRLNVVTAIAQPLAREESLAPKNRTMLQDDGIYHVLKYTPDFQASALRSNPTVFQVTGDHLYVHDMAGGYPTFVRLGSDSNPWIRLRAGMTIRRSFAKIALFTWQLTGYGTANVPTATLYVSTGPLIEDADPIDGLCAGTYADSRGVATTAGVTLFGGLGIGLDTDPKSLPTTGVLGGILVLTNTDLANTLLIKFASPGQQYPLLPGQTLTLTLSQRLYQTSSGGVIIVPLLFTLAGTCTYAFILSPFEIDPTNSMNAYSGALVP